MKMRSYYDYFKNPQNWDVARDYLAMKSIGREEVFLDGLDPVAVQFGTSKNNQPGHFDWLRICRIERPSCGSLIDINIVSGVGRGIGTSALIGSVLIGEGENVIIGRDQYDRLSMNTSRKHVKIDVLSGQEIIAEDLGSLNGTMLRFQDKRTKNDHSDRNQGDNPDYSQDDSSEVAKLHMKYREAYPDLNDVDFSVCHMAIADLCRYGEKNQRERTFNRRFHPDVRKDVRNERVAHQMYNLIKSEIDIG